MNTRPSGARANSKPLYNFLSFAAVCFKALIKRVKNMLSLLRQTSPLDDKKKKKKKI